MDDLTKGFEILKDTILNNITHRDYTRVNDLRKLYLKLFTGENIEDLLKVYHKRTDPEMFEQVCSVYQTVMPEVTNNLSKIFSKIFRSNRVFTSIESESSESVTEVKEYAEKFWAGDNQSGLDAYLATRWFNLQIYDPNAFIAVEFDNVDKITKKTERIFPVEYSSEEAIRYSYVNGVLDWLIVKLPIKYRMRVGDEYTWKDGSRYIMYLENRAIQLTQVDNVQKLTTADDEDYKSEVKISVAEVENGEVITLKNGSMAFLYQTFDLLSDGVPAKRVGYDLDPITNQRTCVSIFHAAVGRFKKEIKAGSELDLAVALHLHAQKLQFADHCEGDESRGIICNDGVQPNGSVCPVCHGDGMKKVSTSSQDIIWVRRPRPEDPMPDLTKYVHYVKTDIEVIRFLYDMVNEITAKAKSAIFGSQAVEKKTVGSTATELDYSMDDVYDTLHPFANSYSSMWMFIMEKIAVFSENDITLYHRFPKDFKLKPLTALVQEAKVASDSGLPQHVLDAIARDISEILYSDDQDTLQKIKVKDRFNPFAGKSQAEINTIILQNKTTRFNQVLYIHFNQVFTMIDNEIGQAFYEEYSYEKQRTEVEVRVKSIIDDIDNEETERRSVLSMSIEE